MRPNPLVNPRQAQLASSTTNLLQQLSWIDIGRYEKIQVIVTRALQD